MLTFADDFTGLGFDRRKWVPAYLPHWSSPQGSMARWTRLADRTRLQILPDQPAWRAMESPMQVSSIQTAHHAGPLGSRVGQHAHRQDLIVTGDHEESRTLFAQRYGRFEAELQAVPDADAMVAFWLIGADASVERSSEICVAEIFGRGDEPGWSVGVGVHPHGDPNVQDDFSAVAVDEDLAATHSYAVLWSPECIEFRLDGRVLKTVEQSIRYPMQLMLSLFRFPERNSEAQAPRDLVLDGASIRVWSWGTPE
jgi:hypothetical protein